MKVNIQVDQLANVIQQFQGNKWQASLQTAGAFDPAAGLGVNFRFGSKSMFSGVHDPKLDTLFAQATSTLDTAKRQQLYDQAAAVHQPERLRAVPVPGQRLEHRGEERDRARADHAAPRLRGAAGDPVGASRVHWLVTVHSTEPSPADLAAAPGPEAAPRCRRLRAPGGGAAWRGVSRILLPRSSLLRLAGRRLLTAIPVVWGVTFLGFAVLNLLPGDAAQALLGADATPAARSPSSAGSCT